MTLSDLKRVHEINNELLLLLDEVCKKHKIEYFLMYGTLLGCIRHGGVIPWDDDVDVGMTRENYKKFVKEAKDDFDNAKYRVKIMGSGSSDYISEIKIGKLGTTYCLPGTEHIDVMNNVQLDIFCIDSMRNLTEKQVVLLTKIWKGLRIVGLNKSEKKLLKLAIDRHNIPIKGFLYKRILDVAHLFRMIIGERRIEKWGYKMLVDPTNQSDKLIVVGFKTIWKKEWFKISYRDYEGRKMPIPSGYDNVLRVHYGDYMKLPNEDHRYSKYFNEWVFKEI
ncbi:lipopolysaccharide cholinephosphotransferase [Xylanibacter ruminicola]|uniref:Lipopolysaccharide cholinephosphotransferase n=1 Tax=Xylanibacter ruminicola TaxID=839 RepID=A0A1H4DRY4_XYLRU|nr:LicD family protein [Xylanibacter ruminicola]SEA75259.1 lipopolysaccharide cholinephosphotransferase [Xylanibacter ruminicola]